MKGFLFGECHHSLVESEKQIMARKREAVIGFLNVTSCEC